MQAIMPIEIFNILEDKLGREDATKVSEAIELSFKAMENKAEDLALQKKLELKDELTKELATKADINLVKADLKLVEVGLRAEIKDVRSEILLVETRLEAKMRLYFVVLLSVILITNPKALELIAKLLGIVK
jgi:hypothetical protein